MRKIILLLLALTTFLMAEVNWQPDYRSAKAEAQKTGKPMLVLLVSHTCRWCRKLENRTLQNPRVVDYINQHFVPVIVYREDRGDDENPAYPDFIESSMVPATFFLTPDEETIIQPSIGYWEPVDYMSDLTMAIRFFEKRKQTDQ
ncbi:MAG: hypothetical protein DSY46_04010 [Hydrogenimonas sp.]|nr:MAG: hypothetical protein DSY46_04010 [Hydrogenimonas sp.]